MGDPHEWIQNQVTALKGLQGQTVLRWVGAEMALREAGAEGLPEWEDKSIPHLQFVRLDADLEGSRVAHLVTFQNDVQWGLGLGEDLRELRLFEPHDQESIFRDREVTELPTGKIDCVDVVKDPIHGDIAEVRITLGQNCITLIAGEVLEELDGSLRIVTMDECILVQVNAKRPTSRI